MEPGLPKLHLSYMAVNVFKNVLVNLSGFIIIGNEHPTLWKIMGIIQTIENKKNVMYLCTVISMGFYYDWACR